MKQKEKSELFVVLFFLDVGLVSRPVLLAFFVLVAVAARWRSRRPAARPPPLTIALFPITISVPVVSVSIARSVGRPAAGTPPSSVAIGVLLPPFVRPRRRRFVSRRCCPSPSVTVSIFIGGVSGGNIPTWRMKRFGGRRKAPLRLLSGFVAFVAVSERVVANKFGYRWRWKNARRNKVGWGRVKIGRWVVKGRWGPRRYETGNSRRRNREVHDLLRVVSLVACHDRNCGWRVDCRRRLMERRHCLLRRHARRDSIGQAVSRCNAKRWNLKKWKENFR